MSDFTFEDFLNTPINNAAQLAADSGVPELAEIISRDYSAPPDPESILYDPSYNPPSIFNPTTPVVATPEVVPTPEVSHQIPNTTFQTIQPSTNQSQNQTQQQRSVQSDIASKNGIANLISNIKNINSGSNSKSVENNNFQQQPIETNTTFRNLVFNPISMQANNNNANIDSNVTNPILNQQSSNIVDLNPKSVVVNNASISPMEQIVQNEIQNNRELRPSIEENTQQSDFEREQQEKNKATQALDRLQTLAQYGQLGMDYTDPIVQSRLQDIDNGQTSSMAKDAYRRIYNSNGEIENPLNWNLLGFSSQQKSSNAINDLYSGLFNNEDYKRDELNRALNPYIPLDNNVVDRTMLDDGSSPESREGLYMTGDQYLRYRELGIPGRDVDSIEPNEIYSKQDEMEKHDFIPYLVSDSGMDRFHNQASAQALNNTFNDIANFRRNTTDFTINYDGKEMSGKDFIQQAKSWSQRNSGKEYEPITDPEQINEDSVPFTFILKDSNGQSHKAPSSNYTGWQGEDGGLYMLFGRTNENGEVEYPSIDANGNWSFSDGQPGTQWHFDNEEDYRNSLIEEVAADNDPTFYWKNMEPLELKNGNKLRADQVAYLLGDKEHPNRYLDYADYGENNWNRPVIEDPFVDNNGNFNLNPTQNSFLPWITDVALGSVPYFWVPSSGALGVSNAAVGSTGFKPSSQDYIGRTYSLLSDNPTQEEVLSSTVGSLALPVTEHMWGNVGSRFLTKPIMKAIGKNEADIRPLVRYGMGAVGEGAEEIPGNIVEQFQQGSGLSNWYADEMFRDANGNLTTEDTGVVARDNQGNVIRNPNTDPINRIRNFGEDIPLAFVGGATLGGSLGMSAIPSYYAEYNPRVQERNEFGNNLVRPEYNPRFEVGLTDEEREYYNNK